MPTSNKRVHRKDSASMSLALHRMFIWSASLILAEAVVLSLAILFYFFDIPKGMKEWIQPTYFIVATVGMFVLNFLIIWITEIKLNRIRKKNDLGAAAIIGSDVQEAYNFGKLGLVVTDEHDTVLWTNTLFRERSIDLLDKNILEWQPGLGELKTAPAEMSQKIEVNGYFYTVKYLADARLYIFKDTTDYEQVSDYNRQQAICIGIIMIDNYGDVAGKTEDDNNDVISKVRNAIFDYGKKMGFLVRRYRNDSYFVVCNYTTLAKMEEDNFSLLNEVRALGKGLQVVPTLSIGFAHQIDDVNKLSEMASNAIDIANSRGGDQAVVSHYGQDLRYFGGKTAKMENTGRVQFRSLADSVIGIINSSTNVIVSGHYIPDMDALGACLGILAICEHLKKPCRIVYDSRYTEKKARMAFQGSFDKATFERITISPKEAEEKVRTGTLYVVVDTSDPSNVVSPKSLEKSAKTIVIDHHRRGEKFVDNPVLNYIDSSAGAASEIIAEMIRYSSANPRIEIPPAYATIMLSGIFLDTAFFKSQRTGVRSFEAAEILKEFGGDNAKADDFLKDEVEEYNLVTKIVSTMTSPYTGVMYSYVEDNEIVEKSTLAKVANQLRELKGVNASFAIGRVSSTMVCVSARSDGTVNVQLLMEKMGRGGGHYTEAGASMDNCTVKVVENKLLEILETYLDEARSDMNGGNRI
ncbi:MAG: DHH family phosphoesterase [Candidatus Enteromonas sp.]|nr:DHH family phosphoesterase [Candidatus Enteromonas sp.]MDY6093777.1 DHH family phosphoesterase [Candidatus Enteromonas sp.]